ncbi:MAG: L,D-transpeptidase family protein [Sphingomicrobium sp.]
MKFACAATLSVFAVGCTTAPEPVPAPVVAAPGPSKPSLPYRWTNGFSDKAREGALATFGVTHLKPGEFLWAPTIPTTGETNVTVDLLTQTAFVWRGEQVVGITTISSGKKGRETPLGFWSVLRKQKVYRSRKYDNAPMPFAQMIDDHGIALHGGALPGYPASHGCVRLPMKFAERLYGLTKAGSKVVVEG